MSNQVEDIPMKATSREERSKARFADLVQVIKDTPMSSILSLNNYVDVFDNYNSWRNGYILDISKSEDVKIRFDGWSSKYDETHKPNSSKVAIFRSHADPYTGGSRLAVRDFKFDRGVDRINHAIVKMQSITIQGFEAQSAPDMCQFLRGDLYFLMDSVLQEQDPLREDELKTSLDFIEAFLRFLVVWLTHLTKSDVIEDYVEGCAAHPSMYYFDAGVCIVSCFPEFFDTLQSLFYGASPRTKKYFQNNETALQRVAAIDGEWAASAKSVQNVAVLGFVNYFGRIGGFDAIADLLAWRGGSKHRLPLVMMKAALPVVEAFSRLLSTTYKGDYLVRLKSIIFERLENLTANDLKDSLQKNLFVVVKLVPKALAQLPHIQQQSEQLEVRLALTFIRSGILEKKIRGVKELTDLIEKVTKSTWRQDDYKVSYFNEALLVQFFAEERVFDTLLNEASNAEVFKRATGILRFMAEQGGLSADQLNALWAGTQNKHQLETKVVLDSIAELAKVLSVDNLDNIYERILKIPLECYDSQMLIFIKDFTQNAVASIQSNLNKNSRFFNKTKQVVKYEFYGLSLLWDLIQDSSTLNTQLMSCAIMSFIQCMKSSALKSERERYILACMDNLKRQTSIPQSLLVAQHTIDSFGAGQMWKGDASEDVLARYSKECNLVAMVVSDLEAYVRANEGVVITDPSTQVLCGKIDHDHNIQYRLEFVEYVNSLLPKKMEITVDLFRKLWTCLILRPLHEQDKTHLLDMMLKSCVLGSKCTLIRDSQIEEIFRSIFCDVHLMPLLTPQLYKSIEKYFLYINTKNSTLAQQKGTIRVSKFDAIVGLDFFWAVVQYCAREDIVSSARVMLINVHLRTEKLSQVDQRLTMWQTFLVRCKDVLRRPQSSDVAKGNIIRCLKALVKGIDGKQYLSGSEPVKAMVKFTVQLGKQESTLKHLQMASNCTLLCMRQHISREFQLGVQDYELFFQNYEVKLAPESEEDYSVSQIEEARDREKVDIIVQGLSSSAYPGAVAIQKFKASLASNWDIGEILFELLQSASEVYFDDIWEVLTLLPENKGIKQQLEKLQTDGTQESWNKMLHFACPRKLLYCLQVVENINKERTQKWQQDFLKAKGVYYLLHYYTKMDATNMALIFNLKCFASLARLIEQFLKSFPLQPTTLIYFDYLQQKQQDAERATNLLLDLCSKSLTYILNFFLKSENKQYKDATSTITDFLSSLMNLVILILQIQPSVWQQQKHLIQRLIQRGLIEFQDQPARKILQQKLIQVCTSTSDKSLTHYLLKLVTDTFDRNLVVTVKENEFLQLLSELLMLLPHQDFKLAFIPQLIDIVLSEQQHESVLGQCFRVLKAAQSASHEAKQLIGASQSLADCLIQDCLFALPKQDGQRVVVARCQAAEPRKEAYQLALQLLPASLDTLLGILSRYVEEAFWRTNSYQDWNIMQVGSQKSRTEFVGLKNLGCICYMNSLMQQLYTLPHFRDSILQVTIEAKPQSVLYQFQLLLSALKQSQKQFYDPRPICNVLGPDQSPINLMEQMDVDEFWSGFMDKLETELKPLRKELIIKRNFGGLLSNELICKGCPHQSSREELFLALPLQVKNKKNIQDSLLAMTEGEMLEGDNAYFCEKCEKKIPTLMRVCVKKLPNILLLVMKRFEFNYETLTKSKLNDHCEFPMMLDMRPYTREYLKAQESEADVEAMDLPNYPPEYYEYQLRGVIIHMGTADSGHYYSLIKDGNTHSWFEFNDTLVRPFDINDLAAEAFGNDDKQRTSTPQSNSGMTRDRSRNAYMVFYERVVYVDDNGKPLRNEGELNWYFNKQEDQQSSPAAQDNAQWYNQEILQDNIKFHVNKIMFERSFFDFSLALLEYALKYIECIHVQQRNPTNNNVSQIGRYCLQFFLVVVVRANERKDLPIYVKPLKQLLKNNLSVSESLIEAFCDKDIVLEFLIHNAVVDMKYIIAGIISTAINCVAQHLDRLLNYQQYKLQSVNAKLAVAWLQQFWDLKREARKCDQFFRVFYLLSVSSANSKFYLLRQKAIGRILLYFLEEPPEGAGYYIKTPARRELVAILKPQKKVEPLTTIKPDTAPPTHVNQWDIAQYNYTYLVATLSELLYAVSINETNIYALDDDELALLEDAQVLQRLQSMSYTKKARTSLSNFMQLLITLQVSDFDPWRTTQRLVTAIYVFMRDCDEREVKTGLVSLGKVAAVKDAFEEQRCLLVSEVLILTLKDGLNCWFYTEIVLDYIIKACSHNTKLMLGIHQVLSNNKSVLKLIENWLKESQNPYNHFQQMRV